jgi:hypothetical protein
MSDIEYVLKGKGAIHCYKKPVLACLTKDCQSLISVAEDSEVMTAVHVKCNQATRGV